MFYYISVVNYFIAHSLFSFIFITEKLKVNLLTCGNLFDVKIPYSLFDFNSVSNVSYLDSFTCS